MKRLEYKPKDFSWISWSVEDIKKIPDEIISAKTRIYDQVKLIPAQERTFENTVYAVESSGYEVGDKIDFLEILLNASPTEAIRAAAHQAIVELQTRLVDLEFDEEIYNALKIVFDKKEPFDEASQKLLDDAMLGYKRAGFLLPKEEREKFKENLKRLGTLSSEFSKNINDYKDSILLSKDETEGLSPEFLEGLNKDALGNYIVTLEYPDLNPFLENSSNSAKRKEIADKNSRKGGEENVEILKEILNLRQKNAEILGYKNHADYRLEVKMAKDTKTALMFVTELMEKTKESVKSNYRLLSDFKREITGKDEDLYYFDTAYVANAHLKKTHNIDPEKIREYFPTEHVIAETMKIYSELLGIKFVLDSSVRLWHEDVKFFKVYDETGEFISYIALDLYPREGKFGHAAVFGIVPGRSEDFAETSYKAPFAAMIANFPKPKKERASLLSHDEAETFFHEFGHLVHNVLTTARYGSQSGTSVAWDFVEAPSQMLEHFVWDKAMLGRLSKHHKTNEPLPEEMINNLLGSKMHLIANFVMRQLVFALFDLTIHTDQSADPISLYRDLVEKNLGYLPSEQQIFAAGFGHLMGYDAGYYGYMWSKVYAVDMFSRFKNEGLLNKKVGKDYRHWILEKGSSIEEIDLVRGFLGREPSNAPFLEEIGVK